jgi:hypothetical protein
MENRMSMQIKVEGKRPFIILAEVQVELATKKDVSWFYGTKKEATEYCENVKNQCNINEIKLYQLSEWIEFKKD